MGFSGWRGEGSACAKWSYERGLEEEIALQGSAKPKRSLGHRGRWYLVGVGSDGDPKSPRQPKISQFQGICLLLNQKILRGRVIVWLFLGESCTT